MDYEIIDKASVPVGRWGKWRRLFEPLSFDKAVKFTFPTREEARKVGMHVCSSLRAGRTTYRTSYRTIPDEDQILLFMWKVPRKEDKGGS